eukprot:scaffold51554_cov34-Phaeocystis_antarctica.AAC.1
MTRRSGPRRSARGRRAGAASRRWPDTSCRATRPLHWGGPIGRKAGAAGSFPFGAWRSERVGIRRNTAAAVAWAAPAEWPPPPHQSALPRARRPGQLSAAASTCVWPSAPGTLCQGGDPCVGERTEAPPPAVGVGALAPLSRASAEVKRGGAFWLRSAITRCNDCATAGEKVRQGPAPLPAALAVAGVGSRKEPAGGALASIA